MICFISLKMVKAAGVPDHLGSVYVQVTQLYEEAQGLLLIGSRGNVILILMLKVDFQNVWLS